MNKIESFKGKYAFLSNFTPAHVRLDGVTYPSVEHAFQAAKTLDDTARARILAAPTAGKAKALGQHVKLRDGWDAMRLDVMRALLRQKFAREPFASRLLATGSVEIVEGNTWGDRFWGVYNGAGENWLGRLLMDVRSELTKNT